MPGGNQAAVEWANGKISTLGQLNGGAWSEALAINTAGQAVGSAAPAGNSLLNAHAVMFSGGKAIDLNVPRGTNPGSAHATAINTSGVIVGDDAGDIVGTAVLTAPDATETTVGYELLPIPTT